MSTCYHATLQGHSWPTEWAEEDIIQGDNKYKTAYATTSNKVSSYKIKIQVLHPNEAMMLLNTLEGLVKSLS